MNAIQVIAEVGKNSKCKAQSFARLPHVSCHVCGVTWFQPDIWYPTVRLKEVNEAPSYVLDRTVSLEEFHRLKEGLVPKAKARRMPPGAGIGPITARLSPYATDFVWSAFLLLAAKPVIQKFEDQGVILPHGPAVVTIGNVRSQAYVALELELYSMSSSKTQETLGIGRCQACGSVRRLKGFDYELIKNTVDEYVAAKAPQDHGLVLDDLNDMIFASEPFMRIYRANKMTGLEFRKMGVWV